MNGIINIEVRNIGAELVPTVNARELHAFLEVKSEFRNWIKNRIADFGFSENVDFLTTVEIYRGGERRDYFVSIDMAKELSMVERNEKGKQARQYFIECERRARGIERPAPALPDFTNPAVAARAWAEQFEAKLALAHQVASLAPKGEFVDRYVESTGLKGFRQVCKLLGANESNFREFLLDKKIMYRLGGEWVPYAEHLDAERFVVKTGTSENTNHTFNQAKFTPKGVNWIAGEWAKYQLVEQD